jgi:hypothetical protein
VGGSRLRLRRLAPSTRGAACGCAYKTAGDAVVYKNEFVNSTSFMKSDKDMRLQSYEVGFFKNIVYIPKIA